MDAQVSLFDRVFANMMAFALPGLVTLVGAATVNPVVAGWFGAASMSPTFVGFLFVLFAALALGTVVTCLRWWIFERLDIGGKRLVSPSAPINDAKRHEHQAAYEDLRFQLYYHYLAYANMSVAIPLAIAIWLSGGQANASQAAVVPVLAIPVVLAMGAGAREAIDRYVSRRRQLLGPAVTA